MRTRFDPLVELRAAQEEEARRALAAAIRAADGVRARLAVLRAAEENGPAVAEAALWELHAAARLRRRAAIEAAEAELARAERVVAEARTKLEAAHRAAESLRRAAAHRREAARVEAVRRERREEDAVATVLFSRRGS